GRGGGAGGGAGEGGEREDAAPLVGVIRGPWLARSHLPIQVQEAGDIGLAVEESLPDEQEVVVLLPSRRGEEQRVTKAVHFGFWILDAGFWMRVSSDGLAEALSQVGMAAGPVHDALEQQ